MKRFMFYYYYLTDPATGVETIDWDFITKIENYPPPTFANNHRSFSFKYNNKTTCKSSNGVDSSNYVSKSSEEPGVNGWGEIKDKTNKKWLMSDEDVIHNIDADNTASIPSNNNEVKPKQVAPPKAVTQVCKPPNKESFIFDEELFKDAVVTPSYRNVDQPQYFYVAEIRKDLSLLRLISFVVSRKNSIVSSTPANVSKLLQNKLASNFIVNIKHHRPSYLQHLSFSRVIRHIQTLLQLQVQSASHQRPPTLARC